MSDSPTLIGRNRAPQRVHSLGNAVPTMPLGRSRSAPPIEKVEPKSSEQLRAEREASRDAQPAVTRCALCEDFVFEGTVGECREAARSHRETMHAAKPKKKTRRENLYGWKQVDDDQRDEAMKVVEQRRAFAARSEAGLEEAAADPSSGPVGAASSSPAVIA